MQCKSKTALRRVLLCLAIAAVAGCGRGPATTPVEGVVTLDGEPLEGASVLFEPEVGAKPAVGVTDAAGKFTLNAYVGPNGVAVAKGMDLNAAPTAGDAEADDTELGDEENAGEDYVENTNDLDSPLKYASSQTSGITIDVKEGMPAVTLQLKSDE